MLGAWLQFTAVAAIATAAFASLLLLFFLYVRLKLFFGRQPRTLAFLHPFCNDGGGGERVLWVAVRELLALPNTAQRWRVVVYTGDAASDDEIRAHALSRFGVAVPPSVRFVRLRTRPAIESKRYPVATLLFQAAGSLILAAEAVCRHPPHILVDTTGLHFCLPLLRLLGVPHLACYVHYPIISSDMLNAVASRRAAHNNRGLVANLALLSYLKLAYYHLLVLCYRLAGRTSNVTMANGTWTANHLIALWRVRPSIVFPPCDTLHLQSLPLNPPRLLPSTECGAVLRAASAALSSPPSSSAAVKAAAGGSGPRGRLVLSVAQFRPEKDQPLQLRAFAQLLTKWRALGSPLPQPVLVMAGAVRHAEDQHRLDELIALSRRLGLIGSLASEVEEAGLVQQLEPPRGASRHRVNVEVLFAPNLKYVELIGLLGYAAVGLHTMWNEHFGIGVVEMLAAGVGTIAHNSGGPALDIITHGVTGLLASTEDEYAEAMAALMLGGDAEAKRAEMAIKGRRSVSSRFSEGSFAEGWVKAMRPLMEE